MNNESQNTFVCQPALDNSKLKKDKGTDYVLGWKSKRVHNFKLKPLCIAFLYSIKLSGYNIGKKLIKII